MKNVDVLIYVHPELSAPDLARLEQETAGEVGVLSAKFDKHQHPHALLIQYNPDVTHAKQVLDAATTQAPPWSACKAANRRLAFGVGAGRFVRLACGFAWQRRRGHALLATLVKLCQSPVNHRDH